MPPNLTPLAQQLRRRLTAAEAAALVDAGVLNSTLQTERPWTLENLREAHRRIEGRRTLGKIVLRLDG